MSKLLSVFLCAIAGIVGLTIGIVLLPLLLPQRVDAWSVAGLAATFAGVMAALLAIIGAAAVAFNWLYLEQRVERVLQAKIDDIKSELFASLRERIGAIGEFAIYWHYPLEQREHYIEQVLQRAPDTPNVAAMMAEEYIAYTAREAETPYFSMKQINQNALSPVDALRHADNWAKKALAARNSHDPGFPEFVMAEVRALQKEPESALDFLKQALQKGPTFRNDIITSDIKWQIFTGMTQGEKQVKKLDEFLKLFNKVRPSSGDIKHHLNNRDNWQRTRFTAIKKSDGDYAMVVVEGFQERFDDPTITWRVRTNHNYDQRPADLNEMMKVIEDTFLPTKLVPSKD